MSAIYRKELRSYFNGMIGAVFAGFILLVAGIYISNYNFTYFTARFEYALQAIPIMYLPAIPVLAMRAVSEERGQHTDQLLYSLPISLSKIVIGKYLAMVTVLAAPLVLIGLVPIIMSFYGSVDFLTSYASLFAMFLLGCALIAICMFISSLTDSQIIAAVASIAAMLVIYLINGITAMIPTTATASLVLFICLAVLVGILLYYLTKNIPLAGGVALVLAAVAVGLYIYKASLFESAFANMLGTLALFNRTSEFYNGIFDMTAVIYYLSFIVFFVFLTTQSMEKKRWSEVD